ncbi:type IV conjugative transfer system protein TraL [Nitrosophilus labii]|uniref:type IV conjugative transfer system protein TraL n=1 Tax=Nitrosophilus labii TaxID=2706014 RepID=UPI0016571350|nr:type IV conjugative transfer system protein TraL [Nitrosophilus labii]
MAPEGYIHINKYIDTKPMFGNWEIDTLVVFSIFIGIAIMFTKGFIPFSTFFGLGVLTATLYEKIKKSKIKGFFLHILYMLGIRQPKTLPPSYMRIFTGA